MTVEKFSKLITAQNISPYLTRKKVSHVVKHGAVKASRLPKSLNKKSRLFTKIHFCLLFTYICDDIHVPEVSGLRIFFIPVTVKCKKVMQSEKKGKETNENIKPKLKMCHDMEHTISE